jgi:hypothetical protein
MWWNFASIDCNKQTKNITFTKPGPAQRFSFTDMPHSFDNYKFFCLLFKREKLMLDKNISHLLLPICPTRSWSRAKEATENCCEAGNGCINVLQILQL